MSTTIYCNVQLLCIESILWTSRTSPILSFKLHRLLELISVLVLIKQRIGTVCCLKTVQLIAVFSAANICNIITVLRSLSFKLFHRHISFLLLDLKRILSTWLLWALSTTLSSFHLNKILTAVLIFSFYSWSPISPAGTRADSALNPLETMTSSKLRARCRWSGEYSWKWL